MTKTNNFYGTVVPEEMVVPLMKLSEQYLNFCHNPYYHYVQWREDFWRLCGHPMLDYISFTTTHALQLGVKEIILTDRATGHDHTLGEFVITLRRFPEDERGVKFESMTPYIDGTAKYHHPHISDSTVCMNTGKMQMNTALMRGDIPEVFAYVTSFLRTLDPFPFRELNCWPLARR